MVEPPARSEFTTPSDLKDAMDRGLSLWDLAQEGSQSSLQAPVSSGGYAEEMSRPVLRWIVGIVGVCGLIFAIGLLATSRPLASSRAGAGGGGASESSPGTAAAAIVPLTTSAAPCSVEALVSNPSAGTTDEIEVSQVPLGAMVTVDLIFAGGSAHYSVASASGGIANVRVAVNAPPSRPVGVWVTAGSSACNTSLTPSEPRSG